MHKYPYLYNQCEDKTGYDEMIGRLTCFHLLDFINFHCKYRTSICFSSTCINKFSELFDFIDGNGFSITEVNDGSYIIIPIPIKNERD